MKDSLRFVTLSDRTGTVQLNFSPRNQEHASRTVDKINVPKESVVCVRGTVVERPDNQKREGEATGSVEIIPEHVYVLNHCLVSSSRRMDVPQD